MISHHVSYLLTNHLLAAVTGSPGTSPAAVSVHELKIIK